jgi:hypothetical protein
MVRWAKGRETADILPEILDIDSYSVEIACFDVAHMIDEHGHNLIQLSKGIKRKEDVMKGWGRIWKEGVKRRGDREEK